MKMLELLLFFKVFKYQTPSCRHWQLFQGVSGWQSSSSCCTRGWPQPQPLYLGRAAPPVGQGQPGTLMPSWDIKGILEGSGEDHMRVGEPYCKIHLHCHFWSTSSVSFRCKASLAQKMPSCYTGPFWLSSGWLDFYVNRICKYERSQCASTGRQWLLKLCKGEYSFPCDYSSIKKDFIGSFKGPECWMASLKLLISAETARIFSDSVCIAY